VSRGFVAIVPPRDALDAVGKVSWSARHRPLELALPRLIGPRWTTRDQWHLTLQFLGTRVDLDSASAALEAVRASVARVRLGGIGGFPKERRANVLWVGVLEGARELAAIAAAVRDEMTAIVESDRSDALEFHPHLTLARLARPADLRPTVARAARAPIGARWTADRLVLFESVTASTGARYREHASVTLLEE
jgi:RNA 2',3'-cyclic 3'-phosphodiesterase